MFHRIQSVKAEPNFFLRVQFVNGKIVRYDVNPLFQMFPAFAPLKTVKGLFESVKPEGFGISWNEHIDLDGEEIYSRGIAVKN